MANRYDKFFKKPVGKNVFILASLIIAFFLTLCSIVYVTESYRGITITVTESYRETRDKRIKVGGVPFSSVETNYGFPLPWVTEYFPERSLDRTALSNQRLIYVNLGFFMFDCFFWWIIVYNILHALYRYRELKFLVRKLWVPLLFILIFLVLPSLDIGARTILFIFIYPSLYIIRYFFLTCPEGY